MYSSSNSTNPFPQLPPYFHLSPPSFVGNDGHDIVLHHHPDLILSDLLSANYPVDIDSISGMAVSNKATSTNQDTSTGLSGHRKKPGKKDRHSKIFTARGPRDRRVRLSIDVAGKFFHLQDMLGFDKASKTLDWLLTKSKAAIKELMQMKHSCSTDGAKSLYSTSECEVVSGTNGAADNGGKRLISLTKEKKMKQSDKDAFYLLARESRAKARARARERTRDKMSTTRLKDSKELSDSNPPILNRSASLSQIEASESMMDSQIDNKMFSVMVSARIQQPISYLKVSQTPRSDLTENSTLTKTKLEPSSIFNDQQYLAKDVSSSNIPQNWEFDGTITRSSFCAMTSMNPLPEFQICSKPWEVCDKQSQC